MVWLIKEKDVRSRGSAFAALLAFALYTGWTMSIADQSLVAFGLELLSRPDTAQVLIDLYAMAVLACLWMLDDARAQGRSWQGVLPYLMLTAVFVSMGPLLYLALRGRAQHG